jgi:hypothetical protein
MHLNKNKANRRKIKMKLISVRWFIVFAVMGFAQLSYDIIVSAPLALIIIQSIVLGAVLCRIVYNKEIVKGAVLEDIANTSPQNSDKKK